MTAMLGNCLKDSGGRKSSQWAELQLVHMAVHFAWKKKRPKVGGSVMNSPPASVGDAGSIPGSGRSPGEGNGNPLQYSCLENSVDRGA